jgi:hypothetical protein
MRVGIAIVVVVLLVIEVLRRWVAIVRPAPPTTLDQLREVLMVRRVIRLVRRGAVRYYVLSCGHEIPAVDYRYALAKKTQLERPLKAQAFCPTCWSVERTRPTGELGR